MFSPAFISFFVAFLDVSLVRGEKKCIIPPYPNNGGFIVYGDESANPGKQVDSYILNVNCNSGYYLDGNYLVSCEEGVGDKLPTCIPYCQTKRPNVLSCGASQQEVSCYLDPATAALASGSGLSERALDDDVCGREGPAVIEIVAGGQTAKKEEVPWHAGIYSKNYQPYMQICGGSLVSPTVVISAAHCFWSDVKKQLPPGEYAVAVGKIYRPWGDPHDNWAQKSDVQEIRIPPRFQGSSTNFQEDIALVIVRNAFIYTRGVKPVCLDFDYGFDSRQLQTGQLGRVAGWGLTSQDGRAAPTLQVASLPYINIEECMADSQPAFREYISGDKICAGYTNGTAVCKGDSGGGLSFPSTVRGSERFFLRGVVSAAPAPQTEHACSVFHWTTFTHVIRHEHFIRAVVVINKSTVSSAPEPSGMFRYADSKSSRFDGPVSSTTTSAYII